MAAAIALVAQDDLRFVVSTLAELAIEREDVVRDPDAGRAVLHLQKAIGKHQAKLPCDHAIAQSRMTSDRQVTTIRPPAPRWRPS